MFSYGLYLATLDRLDQKHQSSSATVNKDGKRLQKPVMSFYVRYARKLMLLLSKYRHFVDISLQMSVVDIINLFPVCKANKVC